MNCMKCGRETVSEQTFCEDCLREMEKYPVRPDTVVKLPERRETTSFRRAPKRRGVNLEEQVRTLKTWVIRLAVLLFITVAIILLLLPSTIAHLTEDHRKPGQNYSVITVTEPKESTEATTP